MKYRNVWAAYFSGTGTTEKIVTKVAAGISRELKLEYMLYDFTLPGARAQHKSFSETDIVVFGLPVIAGRVPNLLLEFLNTVNGNGAPAVPTVLYGNRNFDDALIELKDLLGKRGFQCIAGAAFVGEHSFSNVLAEGRPDPCDMKEADSFARAVSGKISGGDLSLNSAIRVDGTPYPYRQYYQPRDRHGNHIDIRKVIPVTGDNCIDCKTCAEVCPLGSIDYDDVSKLKGICMKCCACIKKCPVGAKSFTDEGFIYHKEELEEMYKRRGRNFIFI